MPCAVAFVWKWYEAMVTTDSRWNEQDAIAWWFRAIDQRVIQVGLHEWRLHVTGIWVDAHEIWIQLADGGGHGGSVLLHASVDTPIDHAIRLLAKFRESTPLMYPAVVNAISPALHEQTNAAQPVQTGQHPATDVT